MTKPELFTDAELSAMSDSDLVTAWWYSDCLDSDEFEAMEVELFKRGIDPMSEKHVSVS